MTQTRLEYTAHS